MNHSQPDDKKRIYLYSHSPETEEAIKAGDATISVGGARRLDGTLLEMAKPLSFSLEELKEMISSDAQTKTQEDHQLSQVIGLTEKTAQELSQIAWLNNSLVSQVYSMTLSGFQQTLAGLQSISAQMNNLGQYIVQRDIGEMKEKADKYAVALEGDYQKLELWPFNEVGLSVSNDLQEIYAFIKRLYEELASGTIDGYLTCSVLAVIIGPFTAVVRKYSILFYYEKGVWAVETDKFIELISKIAMDGIFTEKVQYYINLRTEFPFKDKTLLGHRLSKKIEILPDTIVFDKDYALHHTKEQYLTMTKTIQGYLEEASKIPNDGIIYL